MKPQRAHNFGTYFITTQTWERRSLFQVETTAQLFVRVLYRYCVDGNYLLHEFVVMPNHVHLIITPTEITLERAVQLVKGGFSHALHATGPKLEVWQSGFTDHRIRDWEDYLRHREYLHLNPVRRGLCSVAEQFAYSSAHPRYKLDPVPQRLKPIALAAERHG